MAGALSAEARALAEGDAAIATLIERIGPMSLDDRSRERDDPFGELARIVTGQQVSTAAARTIWERICAEFGGTPGPAEAAAGEQRLRACGLSGRKASYVAGIGAAVASGELDIEALREAPDEAVIEELVKLRGLGRWSAEMFLMFHLERPDVFSAGDLGLRNGIQLALGLEQAPTPAEAEAIAERWRPHRTLAAIYLWAAVAIRPPGAPALTGTEGEKTRPAARNERPASNNGGG